MKKLILYIYIYILFCFKILNTKLCCLWNGSNPVSELSWGVEYPQILEKVVFQENTRS